MGHAYDASCVRQSDPCAILHGAAVCGILTPTFGAHLAAQLESWGISSAAEWEMGGLGGVPKPISSTLTSETKGRFRALREMRFELRNLMARL